MSHDYCLAVDNFELTRIFCLCFTLENGGFDVDPDNVLCCKGFKVVANFKAFLTIES